MYRYLLFVGLVLYKWDRFFMFFFYIGDIFEYEDYLLRLLLFGIWEFLLLIGIVGYFGLEEETVLKIMF